MERVWVNVGLDVRGVGLGQCGTGCKRSGRANECVWVGAGAEGILGEEG
jgi:hypothetical protein